MSNPCDGKRSPDDGGGGICSTTRDPFLSTQQTALTEGVDDLTRALLQMDPQCLTVSPRRTPTLHCSTAPLSTPWPLHGGALSYHSFPPCAERLSHGSGWWWGTVEVTEVEPTELEPSPAPASSNKRRAAAAAEAGPSSVDQHAAAADDTAAAAVPAARKGKAARGSKRARKEPRAEELETTPEAAAKALGKRTLHGYASEHTAATRTAALTVSLPLLDTHATRSLSDLTCVRPAARSGV